MSRDSDRFTFEISLSVLNHLGRNLYRSFVTILGEAISNSWDADAENVWIYLDRESSSLAIKDDGDGMDENDFQNKFLKIGYSKRKTGSMSSRRGRPYIGRKGIGKLALLSCADRISVLSKIKGGKYVGGVIDNSGLDQAILDDLTPQQYELGAVRYENLEPFTYDHVHGTILYFENIKDGIRNTADYLKKVIALYFRFSLLDDSFSIWLNDDKISFEHLADLANKTQFLWNINGLSDPYILSLAKLRKPKKDISHNLAIKGFIASVEKPKNLKMISAEEKIGVDLFVHGRLREKDIIKHIPTARVPESYLYGQIHYDDLDDEAKDRFASGREGIVANDPKFEEMLTGLRDILRQVIEDWDVWRVEIREDGDAENPRIPTRERKSRELYDAVSTDYALPEESDNKDKVDEWVRHLADDAQFNFSSYAECFISENLTRAYIRERNISLGRDEQDEVTKCRNREYANKAAGNVSINLRRDNDDLSYLDMTHLAKSVDQGGTTISLVNDAKEYRPIRDALAHTALLTGEAKRRLAAVYDNIKGRVRTLLSGP